ncbi:unnamed protein product, partial [Scytosiphon promiscuus]
ACPGRTLTDSPVSRKSRASRKMRQGGRLIFWFGARGDTLANHTMLGASKFAARLESRESAPASQSEFTAREHRDGSVRHGTRKVDRYPFGTPGRSNSSSPTPS